MSHASATPISPHSARITETAPARPLLVVETLDHSAGSTMLFTYGTKAAPTGTTPFTFCAEPVPADTTPFTYCAQATSTDTTQFTFCAQTAPADASGAQTAARAAVEGDAVGGSWI
ncbi:hypothetical protein ACWC24_33105 [Streptomyces sp. NPDC001443]